MSPKAKPVTVLPVALSSLAVVLDLPFGTTVTAAETDGDVLLLTLTGDLPPGRIDAEYHVDAIGRRTFTRFKPAAGATPPEDPNPDEKE